MRRQILIYQPEEIQLTRVIDKRFSLVLQVISRFLFIFILLITQRPEIKINTNKMINNINDMMNTITMIHFYKQSRKQHLLITMNQNNNNTMITILNNNRMNILRDLRPQSYEGPCRMHERPKTIVQELTVHIYVNAYC